jgi:pentatricopeptide repeat protein
MLSQVVPFDGSLSDRTKIILISVIAAVFSVQSIYRTGYFSDPVTFWTHAVKGSPHSAYAHTLLGTKTDDPVERERLFMKAYSLDPNLKNLKYYIGKVMFERKAVDSARTFITKELSANEIPDAWFLLAQISFEKNNLDSAAMCLEKVIGLDPFNPQANHNLVLLYFQTGKKEKAKQVLDDMVARGMTPSNDLTGMFKQ